MTVEHFLSKNDVGRVSCTTTVAYICSNLDQPVFNQRAYHNETMFFDIERPRIELNPFAEDSELPLGHVIPPSLSNWERKELGNDGSDYNAGSTKRQQHVYARSKGAEDESNCPHSDGVLHISYHYCPGIYTRNCGVIGIWNSGSDFRIRRVIR